MANPLNKDISGKVVRIKDRYKEEHPEGLDFFVMGGFGSVSLTKGTTMFGIHLETKRKGTVCSSKIDVSAGIIADSLSNYHDKFVK